MMILIYCWVTKQVTAFLKYEVLLPSRKMSGSYKLDSVGAVKVW